MDRITRLLSGQKAGGGESAGADKSKAQEYGLKFVLDSGESRTFTVSPVSIGRQDDNQIVLKEPSVSAKHARIYYDENVKCICIVDLDSLNGLSINDLPTRKNVLHDGDRIKLGNSVLTFWDTGYIHP
jgi:pSer/pThr/pTyr-binding forkhead associated (FHA) protein